MNTSTVAQINEIFNTVSARLASGSPFTTASAAWQGHERLGELAGWWIGLDYRQADKSLALVANTRLEQQARFQVATRQGAGKYTVTVERPAFLAWLGEFVPEARALATAEAMVQEIEAAQPVQTAAARIAADLVAEFGDLGGRIARALELVEAGQIEFPEYHTGYLPGGRVVTRACDCQDAQYRAPRIKGVGTACKHTLAQLIAHRAETEADAVAGRRAVDKIEMRRARPAWAMGQAGLVEMLG